MVESYSPQPVGGKIPGPRITRDAFIFFTPAGEPQRPDFAQCISCRMFVPEKYLAGKIKGDRCIIHGPKQVLGGGWSCGFYVPWATPDGKPVEDTVKAHSGELLKMLANFAKLGSGLITAKISGLVNRLVQCHRCRFSEGEICGLYRELNRKFPGLFDLKEEITPNSCCNAQEVK